MRNTRDFQTPTDAETFRKHLESKGYEEVMLFERTPLLVEMTKCAPYGVSWLEWVD